MSRRGTTVVAWVIGLSALAAQTVIVPIAVAMLEGRAQSPVEVTAPPLPAAPKAEPATDVEHSGHETPSQAEVIALIG